MTYLLVNTKTKKVYNLVNLDNNSDWVVPEGFYLESTGIDNLNIDFLGPTFEEDSLPYLDDVKKYITDIVTKENNNNDVSTPIIIDKNYLNKKANDYGKDLLTLDVISAFSEKTKGGTITAGQKKMVVNYQNEIDNLMAELNELVDELNKGNVLIYNYLPNWAK